MWRAGLIPFFLVSRHSVTVAECILVLWAGLGLFFPLRDIMFTYFSSRRNSISSRRIWPSTRRKAISSRRIQTSTRRTILVHLQVFHHDDGDKWPITCCALHKCSRLSGDC